MRQFKIQLNNINFKIFRFEPEPGLTLKIKIRNITNNNS